MLLGFRAGIMTADQPHQLLWVHVMAMGIENVLPRHGTKVGADVFLVRQFSGGLYRLWIVHW